jgi:hypothetical protein
MGLKPELAVSVTDVLAVSELIAITDACATLPSLITCLAKDPSLEVLAVAVDLGTFRSRWPCTPAMDMTRLIDGYGHGSATRQSPM